MKKLLLIIPLFIISIYALADQCPQYLTASKHLQLAPYIHQIINSDIEEEPHKLEKLQELIGTEVSGWYRFYPEGGTQKEHTLVTGKIVDIKPFKAVPHGEIIYQMKIHSRENGMEQFLFSGTYSPAFSILETTSIPRNTPLAISIETATAPSFDLLSIGLDTPPEVAEYKESLREQEAVVFHDQDDPFYEFANSYRAPIIIDGEIWPSSKHYFQAKKFKDPFNYSSTMNARMDIRVARSSLEATEIVRNLPLRSNWKRVKNKLMFKALAEKFTQHKHLYDLLISTGDAPIIEHTGRDSYWGDGENGSGKSILGNLLMQLRSQLKKGMVFHKGAWFSITSIRNQLLLQIEKLLDPQNVHGAYDLARQVNSSNISDIEKIDKMRMILDLERFFQLKKKNSYKNSTSINEWLAFIHTKYPEDSDFKYQLAKAGVSLAGYDVVITNLDNLHLSKEQKIEIYRMMAHQSPESFMRALPHRFGLSHSEMRELYLYVLQFESSVLYIKELPQEIVDDAFIQEVVNILNEKHIPKQPHSSIEEHKQVCEEIIQDLIHAAALHGLRYNPIYTTYRSINDAANLPCRIDLAKMN